MESLKLSPGLLQSQVNVVDTLVKLLDTVHSWDTEMMLKRFTGCLYWHLVDLTKELWVTMYCIDDNWRRHIIPFDDGDPPASLSQALATYRGTPGSSWDRVTMAASEWQWSVSVLMKSWAKPTERATKLRNACRAMAIEAAAEADKREAHATDWARHLQDEAARHGTAQENVGELSQALGRGEGANGRDTHEIWLRGYVRKVTRDAKRATMERQWMETALGLLERLVAACDEATTFPRELQRLLGYMNDTLEGRKKETSNVPEALVAKVAVAEQLWEANACLATRHLVRTLPDTIKFLFTGDPTSPSACGVAEQCQRAIEDIPRLLQPLEHPQGVPREFPVSMELQELSPALLQSQVTAVAILGELLDTLPRWEEEMILLGSAGRLYWDLEDFTKEIQATVYGVGDAWWHCNVSSDDGDPVTSLSRALAAYKYTPWTTWHDVTMAASKWLQSVAVLVDRWAQLARKATQLPNTCKEVATEVVYRAATATAWAREMQDEAARYGTAQEKMVELGQALVRKEGAKVVARHGAQVRREAREAASKATRATMVRQRVEAALWLLERLVTACDEATAFSRELQSRVGDIRATLKWTNEVSRDVPKNLVAKVAKAEQLWEANAHLAKGHLRGTLDDIIKFYFNCHPANLNVNEVAKRCQRAMEDIPRLLRRLECPQRVPKVSPMSMELQEPFPALLKPQVTVVAILGKLLATLPRWDKMNLLMSLRRLYGDLEDFTKNLSFTLNCADDTRRRHYVNCHNDDPPSSLRQALTAWERTPWTTRYRATMVASEWHRSVAELANKWTRLARAAMNLRNACRDLVTEAADRATTATTRAKNLQNEPSPDGTAQEKTVDLGQALGREEGAKVVARPKAQVRREARVAASEATRATMVRQRLEAALGLLERLVAACDEATAFPRELQHLLEDIEAALKRTSGASPGVPKDLMAKVAEAERLWEANACLAKDHLKGTLQDIKFYFDRCTASPSALRHPKHPQSIFCVSPLFVELKEVSPPQLLEALVSVVATLGKVVATVTGPRRGVQLFVPRKSLHAALRIFTWSLHKTLDHPGVTSLGDHGVPSLAQALATLGTTTGATWADVRAEGIAWQELVAACEERWEQLVEEATIFCDDCEDKAFTWARDLQDKAIRRGTAGDNLAVTAQQLMVAQDRDEEASARMAASTNKTMGEAVVATRRARAAIKRRHGAEMALGPLQRLVATCNKATLFISYMQCQLGDIEAALEGTKEASPHVPEALVAKVAKFEQLWEASARLFKHHLLGTLGDIHNILLSPYGGRGGPDGPGSRAVAERCQKAIEDIPRLLQDSDVTATTSSRQ